LFAGLNYSIAGLNYSIAGLNYSIAGLNYSIAGLNYSIAGLNYSIAGLGYSVYKNNFRGIVGFWGAEPEQSTSERVRKFPWSLGWGRPHKPWGYRTRLDRRGGVELEFEAISLISGHPDERHEGR
jgi:hypothetical protein